VSAGAIDVPEEPRQRFQAPGRRLPDGSRQRLAVGSPESTVASTQRGDEASA
jgi:hypothetical protein